MTSITADAARRLWLFRVGVAVWAKRKLTVTHQTPVSYTHLRAHETDSYLVCRLLLEKKSIFFSLVVFDVLL